jgi:Uncharacterized alpha/beta hydrolase domain (DUF2235)
MSQNFRVIPTNLGAGQKFDPATNTLTLSKAGTFNVTIKEYMDELLALDQKYRTKSSNNAFQDVRNKSLKPGSTEYIEYQKKKAIADKQEAEIKDKRDQLYDKYKNINWYWQLIGNGITPNTNLEPNEGLGKGLERFKLSANGLKLYREINFSKLLEGGGYAWLEVGTKEDKATGKPPQGFFVRATGVAKIIRTEWTDYDLKPITQTVGLGSKVLLNIYTEGLYGQELDIELKNYKFIKNGSLTTRLIAEVNTYKLHANEAGKTGIDGNLINVTKPEAVSEPRIQKAIIEITVNPMWMKGDELEIFPVIINEQTRDEYSIETLSYLKVNHNSPVQKDPADSGNKPLTIGQVDTETQTTNQKTKIDFTFGVFIDGTLNSMYNSIARQKWEEDQIKNKNGDTLNPKNNLAVAAKSQSDINNGSTENAKRYKYEDDSSYENDLSNPAIIYQNYVDNIDERIFKIYSEGMGTSTLAGKEGANKEGLLKNTALYDTDATVGFAFGQGETGMLNRVKRAIELIAEKIVVNKKEKIGTLTIDVFGFSRGAASARNFVHEITLPAASASKSLRVRTNAFGGPTAVELPMVDHNDYEVGEEYADKMLPPNGRLGWHLAKKGLNVGNLVIRFAGLYDSVPHHGILQGNDIKDLGLNSISKSNYTVHLVAGDEHRANFSLVDISCITGKRGGGSTSKGIELYLPGVHCDVGGSYVEGRGEPIGRILVKSPNAAIDLEAERERLIAEGWFKKNEIKIASENLTRSILLGDAKLLSSNREHISNQYSFIPLHIMVDFCKLKGLIIDSDIDKKFKFRDTAFSNATFLQTIEDRLKEYANGGSRYIYEHQVEPEQAIVYATGDKTAVPNEEKRRKEAEIERNIKFNKDIMRLRNEYLHWNAFYGEGKGMMDSIKNVLVQANKPNFEKGLRTREVRG